MAKKSSSLVAGLKAAAGHAQKDVSETSVPFSTPRRGKTVLIGGHFDPVVRRTLLLVQAEPENADKNLQILLGEAINDLCAKYGKPQPYYGPVI